mmetsp:Transcript_80330/g.206713  ORF Transcript_80330/g.206713 Transcript_80330/m.206713 type:complete len:556 (+) Transcript_80330:205-1872(+)
MSCRKMACGDSSALCPLPLCRHSARRSLGAQDCSVHILKRVGISRTCLRYTILPLADGLERVERCRIRVPTVHAATAAIADHSGFLHLGHIQEQHALLHEEVLAPGIGPPHAAGVDLLLEVGPHRFAGVGLQRSIHVVAAVQEEDSLVVVLEQVHPQTRGNQDSVGVRLEGPVVVLPTAIFLHRLPRVHEQIQVARGAANRRAHPGVLELLGLDAWRQLHRLGAEDAEVVAGEDADAVAQLGLDEGHLAAVRAHEREAEQRGLAVGARRDRVLRGGDHEPVHQLGEGHRRSCGGRAARPGVGGRRGRGGGRRRVVEGRGRPRVGRGGGHRPCHRIRRGGGSECGGDGRRRGGRRARAGGSGDGGGRTSRRRGRGRGRGGRLHPGSAPLHPHEGVADHRNIVGVPRRLADGLVHPHEGAAEHRNVLGVLRHRTRRDQQPGGGEGRHSQRDARRAQDGRRAGPPRRRGAARLRHQVGLLVARRQGVRRRGLVAAFPAAAAVAGGADAGCLKLRIVERALREACGRGRDGGVGRNASSGLAPSQVDHAGRHHIPPGDP